MGRRRKHQPRLDKADPLLVKQVRAVQAAGKVLPTSENVYQAIKAEDPSVLRKSEAAAKRDISDILIALRKGGLPIPAAEEESEDEDADGDTEDVHNMLNTSLYGGKPVDAADMAQGAVAETPSLIKRLAAQKRAGQVSVTREDDGPKKRRKRARSDGEQGAQSTARPGSTADPGAAGFGIQMERPTTRFSDMGGIEPCLQDVRELCSYPLQHPEIYKHLGIDPPRGILLHGPPGCGKTMMSRAIAGELGVAFFSVSAPEIVSGMSGESEEKLRKLFEAAQQAAPAIIFIDEIDAVTGKRETSSRGMERRIVAQLLTCMDSLQSTGQSGTDAEAAALNDTVLVIGATNRPDSLDSALRRAGRFDREIAMGIPDADARERILRCITAKMRLAGDFDFAEIARITPGFVGADLDAVAREAAVMAVNRVFSELLDNLGQGGGTHEEGMSLSARERASAALGEHSGPLSAEQLEPVFVQMSDFLQAVGKVQPSAKREGFATVPSTTWDDIGSLAEVRAELSMAITEPIKNPARFKAMGLTAPAGVLLYGPPGCGKTMIAKAIANSSGSNFISVKGPELLNKFVGESERSVRQVFARARSSAPCVVFFDELDSLCPRRGSDGSNGVSERVVNQLLTEMDGLEERRNVFVIAATNRPDIIDPAMLRPGRLDKLLYVPLPTAEDRVAILRTCARSSPLAEDVDLESIARSGALDGFTGADLASLVKEAAINALRRYSAIGEAVPGKPELILREDFDHAMATVLPSVSPRDQRLYKKMTSRLRRARNVQEEERPAGPAEPVKPEL